MHSSSQLAKRVQASQFSERGLYSFSLDLALREHLCTHPRSSTRVLCQTGGLTRRGSRSTWYFYHKTMLASLASTEPRVAAATT